jgi:hypothetical protein
MNYFYSKEIKLIIFMSIAKESLEVYVHSWTNKI